MSRTEKLSAALIVLLNVISSGLLIDRGVFLDDFAGQWRLCAYTLKGVDPYQIIGVEPALIDEIGVIPQGWGTSPWGLILGNFFYAGFLPLPTAEIYFVAINFILLAITARAFYLASDKNVWALILFACPASMIISTVTGNAGGAICCLLLLCLLTCERRPFLTAVMLSIAMVKPQTALAFCLLFLFQRRWRILLTATAIDLGAWLISARTVGQSPIDLLREFFSADIGGGSQFSGLFTLLIDVPLQSIALSMLVGAAFIFMLRKKNWAPCLASAFWSYTYFNEFYLLALPAFHCVRLKMYWAAIVLHVGETFWTSIALWCLTNGLSTTLFSIDAWLYVRTAFCLFIISIGLFLNQSPPSTNAA